MKAATLVLLVTGWLFSSASGQGTNPNPPEMGVGQFLGLNIAEYKIERLTLEAAVSKLQEVASQQTGEAAPAIKIIRYGQNESTEVNIWQARELLTLEVKQDSVANILRYLGDLTGFIRNTDLPQLRLFQVPHFPDNFSMEPSVPSGSMGVAQFVKLKVPKFQCAQISFEAAVSQLREAVAKVSGKQAPVICLVDYERERKGNQNSTSRESSPRISLNLENTAAGEILRYIAELAGRKTMTSNSCIGLYQLLGLSHPREVREFSLKEITAVWGKPQKPIAGWLEKVLPVPMFDTVWVNENTGQVFVTGLTEYMGSVLHPPEGTQKTKKSEK
ncbi:MAG: hypothetical protein ACAH88_11115 [Roseimicrobium sp.]